MAIFRRDDEELAADRSAPDRAATPSRSPAQAPRTFIAQGTRFVGDVSGGTDILVEGELDGEVRLAGTFHVLPEGQFRGNVEADVIRIAGTIEGNVEATQRVELVSTGRIVGDILAPRVAIDEGGFCQGRVEMRRRPGGESDQAKAIPQESLLESPAAT